MSKPVKIFLSTTNLSVGLETGQITEEDLRTSYFLFFDGQTIRSFLTPPIYLTHKRQINPTDGLSPDIYQKIMDALRLARKEGRIIFESEVLSQGSLCDRLIGLNGDDTRKEKVVSPHRPSPLHKFKRPIKRLPNRPLKVLL